ncbi:MAG: FAD-binding protein [Lachnospiraceae bacterium]|nr:FAD-binding protein [Lachnospiraceae bacterium]
MTKLISRRNFLKGTAAGAVSIAASQLFGGASLAEDAAVYTPGTYTASEQGLESTVTVTMTFDETSILDVQIDAAGETAGIGAATPEPLAKAILEAQSADVDAVAGATVTSNAVKKAAQNCIAQAKGEAVAGAEGSETQASGGDDWLGDEPEISDADVYDEVEADVVIVGLGVAGVSAARSASEAGASVIGIDGSAAPNCRSGEYAVLNSPTLNERWPERALSKEDVDEIIDSHVNESGYRVKRSIAKKWADNIGEAFDWWMGADEHLFIADETRQAIEDENADDFLVPIFRPLPSYKDADGNEHVYNWKEERFPCYPTSVEFLPSQAATFNANWEKALDTGLVETYFGHFGKKLIMEDGRCVGVYALDSNPDSATNGKYLKITAKKGVILSTGDYGSNDAAMNHFAPDVMKSHAKNRLFTSFDVNGVPTNQGDGLRMGAWAGAKIQGYNAPMIHHMGGGADLSGVGVMGNAGFLNLDMDGKRYMCEDIPGQQLENQVEQTRLMQSWQFFDANWPEQVTHMPAAHGGACYFEDYASIDEAPKNNQTYRNWKSPYQLEEAIADGRCLTADTLEELVAKVYPDDTAAQEQALASIARYNELAAAGYDDDFHKVASRLLPVDTAPFYADMFTTAIMLVCIGGLESDENCHTFTEVTDENGRQVCGEIIKGLYVAGNMQGGRFGLQYPIGLKGVSHSMAMYYGKIAGENAAAQI